MRGKWRGVNAAGYKSGKMRHVYHQNRVAGVGDFSKLLKINDPGISRVTRDDQFRLLALRDAEDFIII